MNSSMQNKLIIFSLFLIFLIPVGLITGPFIPDLFLVIISVNFLTCLYLENNFSILKKKSVIVFLLFCSIISIVSFFSFNLSSIKSGLFYFRFGLFILAIYFFLNKNDKIFVFLNYLLISIYIILFIDTLYQYNYGKNIIGLDYTNDTNFRITSFFGKDEVLGSYIARLFPFLTFLIFISFNNSLFRKRLTFLLLTITSMIAIIFSGERTAFALFFLFISFIFLSSFNLRKILIFPLILGIIIITGIVSTNEKVKERMFDRTVDQLGLSSNSERLVLFSKTYEGHYLIALKMFKEKPVFGHGPKMFRYYCAKKENFVADHACTTHPHNFYAQMLAESGLIGFSFLIVLYLYILSIFLKNFYFQIKYKKQFISDIGLCLLGSLFINLFPILPSGNFFNNWLSIIMYYPIGFLIYIVKNNKFYA
ncbi:MAG: hypothetical protein CMN00_06195 [Rickettsiales bacterium]|nr:hypothetical protein [Rickettsiales bacterium]|tara:strand:+ start:446 stop:1711 length:1266 start_codon:yes stop_codon:yes gene_type:complete